MKLLIDKINCDAAKENLHLPIVEICYLFETEHCYVSNLYTPYVFAFDVIPYNLHSDNKEVQLYYAWTETIESSFI